MVIDCFSFGRFLKYLLKESVSFSFFNSANFKIAVAVNCLVLEPISKTVFGLFNVLVFNCDAHGKNISCHIGR